MKVFSFNILLKESSISSLKKIINNFFNTINKFSDFLKYFINFIKHHFFLQKRFFRLKVLFEITVKHASNFILKYVNYCDIDINLEINTEKFLN